MTAPRSGPFRQAARLADQLSDDETCRGISHQPGIYERLVLRTANGSSVGSTECVELEALKPPTDFCRRVLVG
jgi:hypothetical protein